MFCSILGVDLDVPGIGSGQEVCFGPSRPDPGRNAWDEDGTRTGPPPLGTWMGPKCCKTKHMVNLDGTPFGPGMGLGRGSGWHPRDSNRRLGLSDHILWIEDEEIGIIGFRGWLKQCNQV